MEQIKKLHKDFEYLLPYFKKIKEVRNKEELKKIYDKYTEYYLLHGMVFAVPRMNFLPQEIRDIALKTREKIQKYNEAIEDVFRESLEKLYPYIKGKSQFILPKEVWTGEIENKKEIYKRIKEREKGFVFYRGEIYTGNINENLTRLGIVTDYKEVQEIKEFKGQPAFKGKTIGRVKVVLGVKDLDKVEKGDILVAAMTMPKYITAMKRASAFVTDEGGITCHAAIVSREMKKPCIIGTKIATQALKDNMRVEVDGFAGTIKILDEKELKVNPL
jgi:phosphohistidine swiveling domain-containing protein